MRRRDLMTGLALAAGLAGTASHGSAATRAPRLVSAADARIRQSYVDSPDGQIYYWSAGTGPTVVAIHQSGNSSEEYAGLVPLLAERCRLVALDLPGHGRSDDPSIEPTVDRYAAAARRVLDALGIDRAHLVGHHGGALTAMSLAAAEPQRFDKVILSGTGGLKSAAQTQAFVDSLLDVDTSIRKSPDFVADAWGRYVDMMSDGAEVADIMKPFLAFLDARLRPYRGVLINLAWDRRPAIERLRGPVLLVQGEKDTYVSGQEMLLDVIAGSSRRIMPGCGTFMFYDRPDLCADLLLDYFEL